MTGLVAPTPADPDRYALPGSSPHLIATGAGYPSARGSSASRPEQTALDVGAGFDGNEAVGSRYNPPADAGPPYTVKGGAWRLGVRLHGVKFAWHAHDRMAERTPLPREHVDKLQTAVDVLDLPRGSYHLPLRHGGKLVGYAQFKGVPNRGRPVLATVLAAHMRPGGTNIEERFARAHLEPGEPEELRKHLLPAKTATALEPETNATMDKPPSISTSPDGDQLDPRPTNSTARTRQALHAGDSSPLDYALRKAFTDLRMTETNTIDTGGVGPELSAR